ncbi:MAG: glycosyltransferase family 2 protein, partial [Acidobacteriota bacterium]
TDDDCRPAPDWVASIVRSFERYPDVDCIGGRVVPEWPDHVPSWFTGLQSGPLAICEHGDHDLPVNAGQAATCLLTANLASRRSAFDKAGLFSTDYPRGQDRELQLRMWRAGCRGMYVPDVVVTVPIPPERLRKQYFRGWFRNYGKVHARLELLDRLDKDGRLVSPPLDSRLFGASPHIYRTFALSVLKWVEATVRRREPDRVYHENRICYFWNYLATSFKRAREAQPGSVVAQVARFVLRRLQ